MKKQTKVCLCSGQMDTAAVCWLHGCRDYGYWGSSICYISASVLTEKMLRIIVLIVICFLTFTQD